MTSKRQGKKHIIEHSKSGKPDLETQKEANLQAILAKNGETTSDLLFWAFRYFLGRRTIHTVYFARMLCEAWEYLDERIQFLIESELDASILRGATLGGSCDRAAWLRLMDKIIRP